MPQVYSFKHKSSCCSKSDSNTIKYKCIKRCCDCLNSERTQYHRMKLRYLLFLVQKTRHIKTATDAAEIHKYSLPLAYTIVIQRVKLVQHAPSFLYPEICFQSWLHFTQNRILKNIYVILAAHSSLFAKNVKKFPRKCRNWATCHPGRVKTCMYNSFDINSPWSENFIPVKTGGVSSPRSEFFFSFLVLTL